MNNHDLMNLFRSRHTKVKSFGYKTICFKLGDRCFAYPRKGGFTIYNTHTRKKIGRADTVEELEEYYLRAEFGIL